jgi:hypothetical protein
MHQSLANPIPALSQLLPGDQITQICHYDTTNADGEFVEFGDATTQEMCYTPIYYYPKIESEWFGSMPLWLNSTWCLSPATTSEFQDSDLSLCAQVMYENVPLFFGFQHEVQSTFDLLAACNGGDAFQDLFDDLPHLCPDCRATASCTAEELAIHAQGLCSELCPTQAGVSLYPDLSSTEPYNYGNFGCNQSYYHEPSIPSAPTCERKGVSSIDSIEVNDIVLMDYTVVPIEETGTNKDEVNVPTGNDNENEPSNLDTSPGVNFVLVDGFILGAGAALVITLF